MAAFEVNGYTGIGMPKERLHEDMFKRELDDWLRSLRTGSEPFVTGASAASVIAIIDAAYRNRRPPRRARTGSARAVRDGHLCGKRVLVTGRAACRTTRSRGRGAGAVRTFRHAARVARFRVDTVALCRFDMAGRNGPTGAVDRLVEGCNKVFHLAWDIHAPRANEEGVRALAGACRRAGVRRLVHVRSLSVYEPLPDGPLTEASPIGHQPRNDKFTAQREIMRMIRDDGIDATIIQPTIVDGPFIGYWTERPAAMLTAGVVVLPAPGDGIC